MSEIIYDWRTLNLQSCDILPCSGNSRFSKRIKQAQKLTGAKGQAAELSHVAGVLHNLDSSACAYYAYESTTMNKWAEKRGVQYNDFELWLENYNGKVWVRHLDFERTFKHNGSDFSFRWSHKNDNYEHGIPGGLELALCVLRMSRFVKQFFPNYKPNFDDNIHCTELMGLRLQHHNLMLSEALANRLPPWMWWSEIDKYINIPVSKPIRIK